MKIEMHFLCSVSPESASDRISERHQRLEAAQPEIHPLLPHEFNRVHGNYLSQQRSWDFIGSLLCKCKPFQINDMETLARRQALAELVAYDQEIGL